MLTAPPDTAEPGDLQTPSSIIDVPERRVAVLLNLNARRVTPKIVKTIAQVVPEEDLYLSTCEEDCSGIAQRIVDRRYSMVFSGGGDGTFMAFVNAIQAELAIRNQYHPQPAPRFGVLKLGTGNGLASVVSASPKDGNRLLRDILKARAGEVPGYRKIDLLDLDGKRAMFAGMGADGQILNDYIFVKEKLARGKLGKRLLSGSRGYFSSVAFRTIPYYLTHSTWADCEVRNGRKGPAWRLAPDGSTVGEPIGPGELIFRGRLNFAAASTIPYYGYRFKMFPFAGRTRGTYQLRLAAVTATSVVTNLRKLWTGQWHAPFIHDLRVEETHIQFERAMPLQVGGDAHGYRSELTIGLSPEPVELLDFSGSLN